MQIVIIAVLFAVAAARPQYPYNAYNPLDQYISAMPRPAPTHTNIFDLYAGSYLNAKGNVQKIKKAGWIAEHWSAALRSGAPSGRSAVGALLGAPLQKMAGALPGALRSDLRSGKHRNQRKVKGK